jgi:uracil phosphoribosyltransferase
MLATGGSAVAALEFLAERGAFRVRLVSLAAVPEGVAHRQARHPDLPIFTAAIDARLNSRGFIVPGLGDGGTACSGSSQKSESQT